MACCTRTSALLIICIRIFFTSATWSYFFLMGCSRLGSYSLEQFITSNNEGLHLTGKQMLIYFRGWWKNEKVLDWDPNPHDSP